MSEGFFGQTPLPSCFLLSVELVPTQDQLYHQDLDLQNQQLHLSEKGKNGQDSSLNYLLLNGHFKSLFPEEL